MMHDTNPKQNQLLENYSKNNNNKKKHKYISLILQVLREARKIRVRKAQMESPE